MINHHNHIFQTDELFTATENAINKVLTYTDKRLVNKKTNNLCVGLLCQFSVDDILLNNKVQLSFGSDFSPYDRIINDFYYDDKVAINSVTHTFSFEEYCFWKKLNSEGKNILINSFEFVEAEQFTFRAKHQINFEIIDKIKKTSNFDNTFYFFIQEAYDLIEIKSKFSK